MAAGEDLYRLDRGAFAELDPTLVLTQDLCAVCAVDVTRGRRRAGVPRLPGRRADARPVDARRDPRFGADCRRSHGHVRRGRRRSWRRVAPGWLPSPAAARRCAAAADARAGVDRPTVHRWSLGAGPRHRGWRTAGAGPTGCQLGRRSVDRHRRLRCRSRDRGAVRVPARWRLRAGHRTFATPACCRRDAELWAVDADAFVVRPGPRVTEGVETFAAILHPDRVGPPEPQPRRGESSEAQRAYLIVRNAARTSSTKIAGCSKAAKCPPFGGSCQ